MSRSLVRSLLVVTALLAAAPRSVGAATSCNGGAAPTLKYYGANTDQPRAFYKNGRQFYAGVRVKF